MEDEVLDDPNSNLLGNDYNNFLASRSQRLTNYAIDSAVYITYIVILVIIEDVFIIGTSFEDNYPLFGGMNLIFFPFIYKWGMESLFGKTLGKFFTKTHVISLKKHPFSTSDAFLRSVLRYTTIIDVFFHFLLGRRKFNITRQNQPNTGYQRRLYCE